LPETVGTKIWNEVEPKEAAGEKAA
jgi:hypothetical protein